MWNYNGWSKRESGSCRRQMGNYRIKEGAEGMEGLMKQLQWSGRNNSSGRKIRKRSRGEKRYRDKSPDER